MYFLKINYITVLLLLYESAAWAQLTAAELDSFQGLVMKRTETLEKYIQIIADKSRSVEERDEAIRQAMKLFVKGATVEVLHGDESRHAGAAMTSSSPMPVEKYFQRLRFLNVSNVKIACFDAPQANDWQVVNDSLYVCHLQLSQKKWPRTGGRIVPVKEHYDRKQVTLALYPRNDPFFGQKQWEVLFGSVVLNPCIHS